MKAKDMTKYERLNNIELPKDKISELGVVGTILAHPDFIYKSEYLKPCHFYNRELASIYYIIQSLQEQGITEIDNFLILNQIESNIGIKRIISEFEDISQDIIGWLDDLKITARSDIESYELLCKRVITTCFKRDTYIKLRELSNSVISSDKSINEINYNVQTEITKYADNYIVDENIQIIGNKADELYEKIKSRRNDSGYAGLPSKFKNLNKYFTYENGELVVIGGRAKSGKSMFFLNEAIHKVENGVPTAIFDTEMSDERWMIRFLSLKTGIDIQKVKNGGSIQEEKKIQEAIQWLKDKPLVHIYDSEWTDDKIFIKAKQLKQSMNLGFLIYDYIKVDNTEGSESEHNILGNKTNFLKNKVAGALDIPVMAGGQMSPREQRLADSDKINRYASTIAYWIHKTKEEIVNDGSDSGNCKLIIDYNRNGEQMEDDEYLNFVFNGNIASISEAKNFCNKGNDNLPY